MAPNAEQLVVAQSGGIHVAPVGTTLPTDPTAALDAAFVELGYVTEDGVAFNAAPEIISHGAWQSRRPVRRDVDTQDITASFALEEWSAETVPLAFGGGTITEPSAGVYRYDFPEGSDALDERAMVIEWADGDKNYRVVIQRGNVTDAVETNLTRTSLAVLPITFGVLDGDVYLLTDDDALSPS